MKDNGSLDCKYHNKQYFQWTKYDINEHVFLNSVNKNHYAKIYNTIRLLITSSSLNLPPSFPYNPAHSHLTFYQFFHPES